MVIVAATIDDGFTPQVVAKMFKDRNMTGLVCGFNPGNCADPLKPAESALVIASLRKQAEYAKALADVGCGPKIMVGPLHTHHKNVRPVWPADEFRRWMDKLQALGVETGLVLALEPLNATEDGTPNAFDTVFEQVRDRDRLGVHWDTGHAHARIAGDKFEKMAHKISFFEFANVGRWPLFHEELGIDFESYAKAMGHLSEDCMVGVEPFDPVVIRTFGLERLYPTNFSGPACLRRDSEYLRELGVMA